MLREGWRPMSGGAIISYRKGLQPLQRYRVRYALPDAYVFVAEIPRTSTGKMMKATLNPC